MQQPVGELAAFKVEETRGRWHSDAMIFYLSSSGSLVLISHRNPHLHIRFFLTTIALATTGSDSY